MCQEVRVNCYKLADFPFLNTSGNRAAVKPEKKARQHKRSKVLEPLQHFLTNNNASEPPLPLPREKGSKSPHAAALSISPKVRDEGGALTPLLRGFEDATAPTTGDIKSDKTVTSGGAGDSTPALMRALSSGVTLNVLNTLLPPSRVKLEEMITLAVLKSTQQSGTVKKMLHAPTLKLYNVKEVPLWSRDARKSIKE